MVNENRMVKADTILINGKILSISADGTRAEGEAVAVADGLILAIGDNESIQQYACEGTEIVDCKGGTILPGFVDGHLHSALAASVFGNCSLFEVSCTQEESSDDAINKYVAEMEHFIAEHPEQTVYRGTGWDRAYFTGGYKNTRWPSRKDLDRICPDKPVIMESYCQHALWTNTKAIELAGLDASTPDPVNGSFTRDENGYPDGTFLEMESKALIIDNMPGYDYTVEEYKTSFLRFQDEIALPSGVTFVNDCMSTENYIEAMKQLAAEGKLKLRVRGVYLLDNINDTARVAEIDGRKGTDNVDDLFGIETIKLFFDGEFATIEPYEQEAIESNGFPEGYCGECFYSDEEVNEGLAKAMATGLQIHIHACGDRVTRQAARGLTYAQNKTGLHQRNVIAHLMLVQDDDKRIMGENGIICNVQPRWMVYDLDSTGNSEVMFGKKRAMEFYPYKSLLEAGCHVACGTDFPVIPSMNPFEGIETAITRCIYEGAALYAPQFKGVPLGPLDDPTKECVGLEDVIRSYTYEGAYQNFMEDVTGSIEPGKSAELVVLGCDLEATPADEIHFIQPEMTFFKGKLVYQK